MNNTKDFIFGILFIIFFRKLEKRSTGWVEFLVPLSSDAPLEPYFHHFKKLPDLPVAHNLHGVPLLPQIAVAHLYVVCH
jgi:hypothetical protein